MFYSEQKKQLKYLNRRTFFLFLGKLGLLSIVGNKLFQIQITESKKYNTLSKNNQINIEILYPVRGLIKDRTGRIIAYNTKVFDLYIIPERSENINETLKNLSKHIKLDYNKKREIIQLSKKVKKFEKIKIFENLNWNKLEIIEANKNYILGIELVSDFQRTYPENEIFSHLLGYVTSLQKKI